MEILRTINTQTDAMTVGENEVTTSLPPMGTLQLSSFPTNGASKVASRILAVERKMARGVTFLAEAYTATEGRVQI